LKPAVTHIELDPIRDVTVPAARNRQQNTARSGAGRDAANTSEKAWLRPRWLRVARAQVSEGKPRYQPRKRALESKLEVERR
jgi:hypothetical protein